MLVSLFLLAKILTQLLLELLTSSGVRLADLLFAIFLDFGQWSIYHSQAIALPLTIRNHDKIQMRMLESR